MPLNVLNATQDDMHMLLERVLYEFPITRVHFDTPDWLGALPDGTPVTAPAESVAETIRQAPEHPYARIGAERFGALAAEAAALLAEAGVAVEGDAARNHYRLTPMGGLKPAWLTLAGYVRSEASDALPWRKAVLFNAEGFLDFYTQFLAEGFRRMGTECAVRTFNMPALETIRNNPSEMRSANIARIFDRQENLDELARILRREAGDAEAVLLPDEKEEGVAVVDVGGGVTDVTVYYRNVVRYIASIPIGASAINRDIRTMSVPEKHVESLKQKYGSAVAELAPEDKLIRVNGRTAREAKDILLRNLATVIEARATDIAEFVQQEIKDSGFAGKLAYGIVLTGGSAKLKDLDELFRRVTGMDVRVAVPEAGITEESKEKIADPAYSTAVGILLKGAEQGGCAVVERPAAPRPEMRQPAPQPPVGGYKAPQPRVAQPYAAPAKPVPQPVPQPEAEPAEEQDAPREDERPPVVEPKRKRGFGSIVMSAIDKINKGFSAAEDEEI